MSEQLDFSAISDNLPESLDVPMDSPFSDLPKGDNESLYDMLGEIEIDPEKASALEAELYLPNGEYIWYEGKVNYREHTYDNDRNEEDSFFKKGKGRYVGTLYGTVLDPTSGRRGRFEYQFSPDKRTDPKDKTQIDFLSQNWARLTQFFKQRMERTHKNPREVIDLMRMAQYSMYLTRGSNRNYLRQFKELGS